MAVEVFIGNYITAEDAQQYIDYNTISEGCRMMKEAAEKLSQISKKIDVLKDTCSLETISVQGKGMEKYIEPYEKDTRDMALYIQDLSSTILDATVRVLNRKQTILNEAAKLYEHKESLLRQQEEEERLQKNRYQEAKGEYTEALVPAPKEDLEEYEEVNMDLKTRGDVHE
ncbi:MAG: hypothetical protein J6X28_00490 [Bacilli bacterium]|nr:hypothetical protein [Bacilli bacterium]